MLEKQINPSDNKLCGYQSIFHYPINPITPGGAGFRTPSNFAAFGDPLTVKYIAMFHADFSYLSIY